MGQGRNSVFLALKGWDVTGFDLTVSYPEVTPVPATRRDCVASIFAAGPPRTIRLPYGGVCELAMFFHGPMVSMMILIPANALSI